MKGIMTWGYECWGCSWGDLLVPKRVRQNNSILHPFEYIPSLKLTAFSHLRNGMVGKRLLFLLGQFWPIFRGKLAVSFREIMTWGYECNLQMSTNLWPSDLT